jgi:hypothetical protein
MTQPEIEGPPSGGILKSNVGSVEADAPKPARPRVFPMAAALGGLVLLISGVAAGLLLATSAQQRPTPTPVTTRTAATTAAAPLPDINGISCDALESTIVHIHVHLAIFFDGAEQQLPFGVGIGQPWQVTSSDQGPFVTDGSCFYWVHTHTGDGVVHIESPVRRRFTLGDFFAIWQVPLSSTQVGPGQGQVISYVNGQQTGTNPPDIPLLPHERIQLDVGTDVPPYQFDFAPGD